MNWPNLKFPPINLWSAPMQKIDAGKHYRYSYKGFNIDPFRIAYIYKIESFAMMTILKKCLCAGKRGHKDYSQDLRDIISAAERELEIIAEDDKVM